MQEEQVDSDVAHSGLQSLLTARQVQGLLAIDRSTVYRMADDGRLPAIRVGKQWRFRRDEILAVLSAAPSWDARSDQSAVVPAAAIVDRDVAIAATDVAANLLGVMMMVTDMAGQPITAIANPCDWFIRNSTDTEAMRSCVTEWRELANAHDFAPTFQLGELGFECARSFIRSGHELVGMVLAGGVNPLGTTSTELYSLTESERTAVLRALPLVASAIAARIPAKVDQSMGVTR
ncbi:MAG: helix-turn-helix domain-containing protein [Actinobacteria bacterium]|nr:helix-turn-helix domain-containing protein [Actinomycetota bacterium]